MSIDRRTATDGGEGIAVADALATPDPAVDRRALAGQRPDATGHPPTRIRPPSRAVDLLVELHGATRHGVPLAVDTALLVLAGFLAGVHWPGGDLLWAGAAMAACYVAQVYADRDSVQTQGVLWYVLRPMAALVTVGFVAAASGLVGGERAGLLVGWSLALLVGLRCLLWPVLLVLRRNGLALRRTLIVGTDETADALWRRLTEFPEAGLIPVKQVSWSLTTSAEVVEAEIVSHDISHVVLVARQPDTLRFTGSLRGESKRRVRFSVVPVFAEFFVNPGTMTTVASIPLLPLGQVMRLRRSYAGKRALDLLGSFALLLLSVPVIAITALAIKLEDGGPVFFRQTRVGLEGRTFQMLKLRSMQVGAEGLVESYQADNASDGLLFKLHTDPRVTRVGRFIRRTSIDELPQLINVLLGQMSLVGPRPLPVAPDRFDAWDNERHAALPGITGYWQISGGSALGYDEMVRLDLAYIRNASLLLDLRLIARTIPALLHRRGPA
jgi:exopolysaccharide biosynthesis polyprenyl glycosylphosphotransferase